MATRHDPDGTEGPVDSTGTDNASHPNDHTNPNPTDRPTMDGGAQSQNEPTRAERLRAEAGNKHSGDNTPSQADQATTRGVTDDSGSTAAGGTSRASDADRGVTDTDTNRGVTGTDTDRGVTGSDRTHDDRSHGAPAAAAGGAGAAGAAASARRDDDAHTTRRSEPATTTRRDTDGDREERLRAEATEQRRTSAYELARAKSRNTRMTDLGLLLLRVLPVIMFLHGLHKAQGFSGFRDGLSRNSVGALAPDLFAILVVAGQLALPILIALGFFTRLSALLMTIMMVGIWAFVQLPQGLIDPANGGIRGESALLYAFLALPLIFTGPGRFSLDHGLFGKRADKRAQRKADKAVA